MRANKAEKEKFIQDVKHLRREEARDGLAKGISPVKSLKHSLLYEGGVKSFQLLESLGVDVMGEEWRMLRKAVKLLNFSLASWLLAKVDSQSLTPLFVGELIEEVFNDEFYGVSDLSRKQDIKYNKKKVTRMLKFLLSLPAGSLLPIPGRDAGEKISFLHNRRRMDMEFFIFIINSWWERGNDVKFSQKFTSFLDKGAYPISCAFSHFLEINSPDSLPEMNYVLRKGPPADRPWLRLKYRIAECIYRYCARRRLFDTIFLISPYLKTVKLCYKSAF